MTTVSIPLPEEMLKQIKFFINEKAGENVSQFVRGAIQKRLENEAVEAVLRAVNEPRLEGDLDDLASRI